MLRRSLISCIAVFAFSSAANAAPLGLTLLDAPDIFSSFIDVTYDASTDSLSAMGFALELNDGIGVNDITNGMFTLDAVIDDAGNMSSGSFTIGGTIAALGYVSDTLLTGTLDAFGFAPGGDPLEFLFTVTGGDAAALYGGSGGMVLAGTGFSGSWASDFDNLISGIPGTGQGVSDVAAVPIPAAAWLFLTAILSLAATRRRS